jgi:hypothetical protein
MRGGKTPLIMANGGEKDTPHKQNSERAKTIGLREKILRRGLQFFSRHSASVSESNYGGPDCSIDRVEVSTTSAQLAANGISLAREAVATESAPFLPSSGSHQHCRQQQRSVCW